MRQLFSACLQLIDPHERSILFTSIGLVVPMYAYCWYFWPGGTFFWTLLGIAILGLVGSSGIMYTVGLRIRGYYLSDIDPDADDVNPTGPVAEFPEQNGEWPDVPGQ
jgi:hypothetical protein